MLAKNLKVSKILIIAFLILSCFSLCASCNVSQMSNLDDMSKPHCNQYTCVKMRFGEIDLLERYKTITLELKSSGEYIYSMRDENGKKIVKSGKYIFDRDTDMITISENIMSKKVEVSFPASNGRIVVSKNFLNKPFLAVFELK